jgi:hypothetical protein
MRETVVRAAGVVGVLAYGGFIAWLYMSQPATMAAVTGGLTDAIGVYRVDAQAFDDGVRYFRNDQFVEARAAFGRADPALRDPPTQFYVAYSFYRQGWGRVYSDDALFRQGLEAVNRAIANASGGRLVVEEPSQQLGTADALKAELEAGLVRDSSDLNPLRVFRTRK